MLQFFEWFWEAIGIPARLGMADGQSFQGFFIWMYNQFSGQGKDLPAALTFCGAALLCSILPYLLGSLNTAIIVSRLKYHDDIRNHGSGNAGLTNMARVFGKKGALLTLLGDMAKQFVSVVIGIVVCGEWGAYLAGVFCMFGHIFPLYYHFRGGKGVLTAATMILMIDWQVFLIAFALFVLTVLLTRYVSLGSIIAGFALPGIVYTSAKVRGFAPGLPAMIFSIFIGLMLIFMHRSNIRRLFEGTENKFKFKK
ncbi:MAG: glycerol-3-phosphate 1-O-acyltransferase PlsY [Oscillospiraceae bacterium]|nr:glycerol-3-phosphate 1-O-acyltransferase PlsY [Oscillospiraceae bacterium]